MANLSETQTYEPGIYQLETTDKLMGGAEGISNRQGAQLANRTAWLKANSLMASPGTFTATLHMHSDPTNITDTNVTAEATGNYVRVGEMVWVNLESNVTQYNNHTLKHISGLPFPAAQRTAFSVGEALGVRWRWSHAERTAARLYAVVETGAVRMAMNAVQTNGDLYASFWQIMNRPSKNKTFQITGWYRASV